MQTSLISLKIYPLGSVNMQSVILMFMNLSIDLSIPLYVQPDFNSTIICVFSDTFNAWRGNQVVNMFTIFFWGIISSSVAISLQQTSLFKHQIILIKDHRQSRGIPMQKERPYNDRYDEASKSLMLDSCNVHDSGVQKILAYDWSDLQKIDLSTNMNYSLGSNQLTDASLEQFSKFKWENLVSLHLGKNQITDKGVIALMKVQFPQLRSLWFNSQKSLGDEGIIAISNGDPPKLQILWLSFNKITAKGIQHFTKKKWDNLIKLHLAANHFGPKGAYALSQGYFPHLTHLQIYDCGLGNQGVKNIAKGSWPNIKQLHLSNNGITDEGISYLVDNPWPSVDFLHLSTNPFGQQGAKAILGHAWPNLKRIKMKRTKKIPEQLKQMLRTKFFPKTQITFDP